MKYIDAEKLIAEIERQIDCSSKRIHPGKNDGTSTHYRGEVTALFTIKSVVTSLQQVRPEDKKIIIITESHGNANIEWDCRSLDDVIALLKSAKTFITEKQIEKMVGPRRSGPDYATIEGRYSHLFKRQQKQPKPSNNLVDADAVREDFITQVYRVLDADPTNDRANAIIDAFDSLPTVSQVQPEVDLKEEAYMRGFAQGAKEEREAFTPLINRLCEAILFEWEDAADLARKTLIQIKEN